MYIISLIQAGRWDEYRRFMAFLKLIHPGSIGVYKWSGRFPGPGDRRPLRHWRRGGGVHRHRRVSRRTSVSTRLPQPRSIQNEPLLNQLAIYEVEEISEEARHDAAAYAVTQYENRLFLFGLVVNSGEATGEKKWYCTELVVKALEQGGVTFYQGNGVLYVDRFVPLLPVEMPYYRTTAGSNSAWAITTRWGNSSPLRKTW